MESDFETESEGIVDRHGQEAHNQDTAREPEHRGQVKDAEPEVDQVQITVG